MEEPDEMSLAADSDGAGCEKPHMCKIVCTLSALVADAISTPTCAFELWA